MKTIPLPNLQGFKFYRVGRQGLALELPKALTAEEAYELGLDLSADKVKWFPAFTETTS